MIGKQVRVLAVAMALSATALPLKAEEAWTPTGYDEHEKAAWAVLQMLCGPDAPEAYAGPGAEDVCPNIHDNTLVWLGTLTAWVELTPGSADTIQFFPELDAPVMRRIEALAADAQPDWIVDSDPALANAPEVVRQQVLGTINRVYDSQIRTGVAIVKAEDPAFLGLEE